MNVIALFGSLSTVPKVFFVEVGESGLQVLLDLRGLILPGDGGSTWERGGKLCVGLLRSSAGAMLPAAPWSNGFVGFGVQPGLGSISRNLCWGRNSVLVPSAKCFRTSVCLIMVSWPLVAWVLGSWGW